MAAQRFGTRSTGGIVERVDVDLRADGAPPHRPWRWAGWRRSEQMQGVADDRTNALLALWHFLDPNEDGLDDDARS